LPYFETPERTQQTLSSLEILWVIFRRLVQEPDLGTIFCVLDGLDECEDETLGVLVRKIANNLSPKSSQPTIRLFSSADTYPVYRLVHK
jgi:hypothetical protein